MPSSSPSTAARSWSVTSWLPGLEMLRGLAALMVVVHHAGQQTFGEWRGPSAVLSEWLGGWGVTLFFVLSGFCIHLPQARRLEADPATQVDWRLYARRRARRLVPTYYAALVLSALVGLWTTTNLITPPTWGAFALHGLFVHTWSDRFFYSINCVFWSIAVEVHFYAVYPLYLWLRRRLGTPAVTALLAVVGIGLYTAASRAGDWRIVLQQLFLASWWKWALGAWMAEVYVGARAGRWARLLTFRAAPWVWGVASLAIALLPLTLAGFNLRGPLLPVLCALWIGAVVVRPARQRSPFAALGRLGLVSYSLYLVHPVAIALVRPLLAGAPLALTYAVEIVGSVPVAVLFFFVVERQFVQQRAPAPREMSAPQLAAE